MGPHSTTSQQTEEELLSCCINSFKWSNHATITLARAALVGGIHRSQTDAESDCHSHDPNDQGRSSSLCGTDKNFITRSQVTKRETSSSSSSVSRLILLIRVMLLDVPLVVICSLMLATLSARHLYANYWTPIMDHLTWTPDKQNSRRTYYRRECSPSDIVPKRPDDMFIDPTTSTPLDAADKVMRYGGAVFPNILSPDSMAAMREFVLRQNRNLNEDMEIPLNSQYHRWSFAIGGDMDPSVPPILREIATNAFLQSSLEVLFGKDPAVVEFTAITSAYGAGSQDWHADTSFGSSYMHFARSFVPYYSLFIPLQDTSSSMGATSVCPGTHFCGKVSNLEDMCENLGFQVSDTEDGVWRAGDAFLMHLNVYHRGPAHTDPDSPERVMLIMSIAPRPIGTHLETRQLGLGTSYSQRWDMWGLTMKDLVNIEAAMWWPRKVLRTFGIYKSWKGTHDSNSVKWGWDYLTVACSRIVNNQMGFRYRDLKKFARKMRKTGILTHILFGYLPDLEKLSESDGTGERKYSQDIDEPTGWREYIAETLRRLTVAFSLVYSFYLIFYLAAASLTRTTKGIMSRIVTTFIIAALFNGIFLEYVARSRWGRDARNLRSRSDPFSKSATTRSAAVHSKYITNRPTTLPYKTDVFLSTRLDSHTFHAHNTIYDYQIGNQLWHSLMDDVSGIVHSPNVKLTPAVHSGLVANIVQRIDKTGGRFLLQNEEGHWEIVKSPDAMRLTDIHIQAQSHIVRKRIHNEIKNSISTCHHGRLRDTVMSSSFCLFLLNNIRDALFPSKAYTRPNKVENLQGKTLFRLDQISAIHPVKKESASIKHSFGTSHRRKFELEDVVEGYFSEGWFRGTVIDFDADDTYIVRYDDGNVYYKQFQLRPFIPYESGQIIEAYVNGVTRQGRISVITTDSTFSIVTDDSSVFDRVSLSRVNRIS